MRRSSVRARVAPRNELPGITLTDTSFQLGVTSPLTVTVNCTSWEVVSRGPSDDDLGMRLAVDHLASLGHRQIAHVAGPLSTSTGSLRRDGFARAMSYHGWRGVVREATGYTREAGARAAASLLDDESGITAIVAANDLLALGVLDVLKERRLRCPQDSSLVGHNDMPLMDVVSPPLTTIRIEHREMGQIAARMLVETIKRDSTEIRHVVLRPELVVRSSTQAIDPD